MICVQCGSRLNEQTALCPICIPVNPFSDKSTEHNFAGSIDGGSQPKYKNAIYHGKASEKQKSGYEKPLNRFPGGINPYLASDEE